MRRSCAEIERARAASPRSWASMNAGERGRVRPRWVRRRDQSARRAGKCACSVARARWRACSRRARSCRAPRRLDRRPAQDVAGDEGGPLPGRQDLERRQEGELDGLALDDDGVGLVVGRRDLVEQRGPGRAAARAPRRTTASRSTARAFRRRTVKAHVGRDPVEPCPEQRPPSKLTRGPATPGGTSPGRRPRPRRTRRASGSNGRGARAGSARSAPRTRALHRRATEVGDCQVGHAGPRHADLVGGPVALDLLDQPGVAVGILPGRGRWRSLRRSGSSPGVWPASPKWNGSLTSTPRPTQLGPGGFDVGRRHRCRPCSEPGLPSVDDGPDSDRAGRARSGSAARHGSRRPRWSSRRSKPELIEVEGLGPVEVGDRNDHEFELKSMVLPPVSATGRMADLEV